MDFPSKCNGGEFYSAEDDLCISCFCMGIPSDVQGTPTPCQSSDYYRNEEIINFYDETFGFSLTDENFAEEISDLDVNSTSRELFFDNIANLNPDVSNIRYLCNLKLQYFKALRVEYKYQNSIIEFQ